MKRVVRVMVDAAALLAVAAFIALSVVPGTEVPGTEATGMETPGSDESVRAHILEQGTAETGSLNLVTAIYLGYRAYDTLGETVVLLLAVSGIVYLVGAKR
jgi:multisubunit Na+/H+ antiporter MnhB subunit